ncbi:YkgJ family cysteine cluster protein [Bdellovibrio sp. HCB337]|uniref:YkgJ family cysteine cluster protein n=1 Tax=Bdellovibrio sp. HCB337 TaxID=3394358 RepID=UPI0039A67057
MTLNTFLKTHPKITRSLRNFVKDYEQKLDTDTFSSFLETLAEEIRKAAEAFQSMPAGPARAFKLQELVDREIAQQGENIKVSCFKGCSACCHMEVEVTSDEAEALADLVTQGHTIDRERLQKLSLRALQDRKWKEGMKNSENRCVFLSTEGSCSIYEKRPVMCRRHSVTSPAKNCEDFNAGVTLRYFPTVDLLISAANTGTDMEVGPLAKMLQIRIQR